MNNATKHLQLLIDSGYDDINYICDTRDEDLLDIGIVDYADREQVHQQHVWNIAQNVIVCISVFSLYLWLVGMFFIWYLILKLFCQHNSTLYVSHKYTLGMSNLYCDFPPINFIKCGALPADILSIRFIRFIVIS